MVTSSHAELAQDCQHCLYIARSIGVVRMAGYSDVAIFCDWTGRPGLAAHFGKPLVRGIVVHGIAMHVHRIAQSQHEVDV